MGRRIIAQQPDHKCFFCGGTGVSAAYMIQKLRDYRASLGIKQKEIAAEMKVSVATLANWETMRYNPAWKEVVAYEKAIGVLVERWELEKVI